MKRTFLIAGLVALVGVATPAFGDIYRWRDADGVTRFSNQPPPPGVKVLDKIEETPYDPEADRRRREEDRRMRLEFEKLDLDQRQAEVAAREREAQRKLQEAERRLEQSQPKSERTEECDEVYYLRYGTCGPGGIYYRHSGNSGPRDLYRGVYRENNSLYYRKPARRPGADAPKRLEDKPPASHPQAPKPSEAKPTAKSGKKPVAPAELEPPVPPVSGAPPRKR
jgi:hypothetical protein